MSQRRETTTSFMFFGVNKEKIYTISLKSIWKKDYFPSFCNCHQLLVSVLRSSN